ncbi:MAG: sugar kinase [Lachnospiraceae bacterium]|nr:sugar kinase [Lachnospiraceae bacterium]
MGTVVTFGEIMLRLAPEGYYRFFQNDRLQATFGGGEANVAVSLANFGVNSKFVTKLPAHAIGEGAVSALRGLRVDTGSIVRGGERIGIYYLEKGASQRGSVCIYDRAHSAIQEAEPGDFDWDRIFDGAEWFHFTGITPALGPNLVNICIDACKAAKTKGIKISCDLNYRNKLWTRQQAREAMTKLCEYVDVCISNEEDAKDVFGIEAEGSDIIGGKLDREGYKSVAKQLADRFEFEKVAITLRTSLSASDNDWQGMLYDGSENYFSKQYHLHIVDRVGGGDSFGAGLIYSFLNGYSSQESIEFAVAASALKHSIEGDFNRVTVEEVQKLAGGDGSGRVQR